MLPETRAERLRTGRVPRAAQCEGPKSKTSSVFTFC